MIKSIKILSLYIFLLSITSAQELCPPALVEALFYDEKIELSWDQTTSWGDLLFDKCFTDCELAAQAMVVEHNDENCLDCTGGWFRNTNGEPTNCGEGMYPCEDGGEDTYSAYSPYSYHDSLATQNEDGTYPYGAVDSRLITTEIDLTQYSSAFIEFTEAYTYPEDANDSNMVEVSINGGETWDVVYYSDPIEVGEDFWANGIDISEYVGNTIHVAFRYYDSVGYGEAWFVDDIRVWGSYADPEDPNFDPNLCGTFSHYNIYMDGVEVGSSDTSFFSVENLENDVEYCFGITAVYEEGESDQSFGVCASPKGPFQVNPLSISSEELSSGQYIEHDFIIANFDTTHIDFDISSIELSNVDAAMDILWDDMENYFAIFSDADGLWSVGDSAMASSTYLNIDVPDNGGQFGFYNDDAAGDLPESPASPMLVSYDFSTSGMYPPFLLFDLFFPNPSGPCENDGAYADDFLVHVSTDQGATWTLIDSTLSTGYDWFSYMINLHPYLNGSTQFRVGFQYTDCGGNWGYGVAVDNIRIKEGDDFTWLTVSPYRGTANVSGTATDSIKVKVGMYGVYDGFSIEDDLLIEGTSRLSIPDEYSITVQLAVGAQVSIDESEITPFEFALHQNYPNPFNPETKIQFDVAENSHISIAIFNLAGQKVATLANSTMEVGKYTITWGGLNDKGTPLPSGMYFYKMNSSSYQSIKKMVLVK